MGLSPADMSNRLDSSEVEIDTLVPTVSFLPLRVSSILDTVKPSRQLFAIQAGQVQPSSTIPDRTSHWNSRQLRKGFNSQFRWRWRIDIAEEEEPMVQRDTSFHRLRNCRMERHATCSVRERCGEYDLWHLSDVVPDVFDITYLCSKPHGHTSNRYS